MSIRLIPAPLELSLSESRNEEQFEREFQLLSGADDDAIGQWLKIAKAKGETQETDSVLLQLIVELHRKIDNLERLIKNEEEVRLELDHDTLIDAIGFEHIQLKEAILHTGSSYYARIKMPIYPKRDVAVFVTAIDDNVAKIDRIHERDQTEWNAYVTARERIMIRQLKGKQ